jgi:hypothetical protein
MILNGSKTFGAVLLGLAGLVGCNDKASMTEFFGPEDQTRRVHQAMNSQANCGAREDAMLYAAHFTDGKLNSLGAAKLARLVPDEADAVVHLYLDVPDNELATSRKEAVVTYLHACGVDDARLKLAIGPNPNLNTPAAPGLSSLSKTDTGSVTGGQGEAATDGTPSYAPQAGAALQQ